MLITSKDNNRIKEVRKLLTRKHSLSKELFLIEGENLIEEAIKNNLLKELYVLEGHNCKYDFPYIRNMVYPQSVFSKRPA